MKIGYARISSATQNLDIQREELFKFGCEVIYEDVASGKNTQREEFQNCLKSLRAGDTLVVWKLDRLGRSIRDAVFIFDELKQKEIKLISIKDGIDTSNKLSEMFFYIASIFAEMEREYIKERTQKGLEKAKSRGVKFGRPKKLKWLQVEAIEKTYLDKNHSYKEIALMFNTSVSSVYRIVKNLINSNSNI